MAERAKMIEMMEVETIEEECLQILDEYIQKRRDIFQLKFD